ncbi:MAG: tRNA (adenosine(37)-N6)-dimethylallyltransferase MiaA [Alphaproteobacteria bacterium]|nr:tRNA (adenosine(37)-N6)-dimethylallyltransferase MiaA [Alphaproteobacteria bacterium]
MSDNEGFPAVVVAGPTCSGKSALALDLAVTFGGTVINADSMQVYRELRVLTARPDAADEARAPHRLYGVIPAAEPCSAARWRSLAVAAIAEAREQGRAPIVCGGTGLYLRALMEGLSPLPDVPGEVREAVRARFAPAGTTAIHDALREADPKAAARLAATDRQRLLRAWEIFEATGVSIVDWQDRPPSGPPPGIGFRTILLMPPRDATYAACDARLRRMVEEGALDEVRRLRDLQLDPALPVMKALGVAELIAYLDDGLDREAAIAAAQQATRNYVKRQYTWFSRQIIADIVIEEKFSENIRDEIFSFICKKGLTTAS